MDVANRQLPRPQGFIVESPDFVAVGSRGPADREHSAPDRRTQAAASPRTEAGLIRNFGSTRTSGRGAEPTQGMGFVTLPEGCQVLETLLSTQARQSASPGCASSSAGSGSV